MCSVLSPLITSFSLSVLVCFAIQWVYDVVSDNLLDMGFQFYTRIDSGHA